MYKSNLKTECIKGYFPEDIAADIRSLAKQCGMSTSHFLRDVVEQKIKEIQINSNHNVIYFKPPGQNNQG